MTFSTVFQASDLWRTEFLAAAQGGAYHDTDGFTLTMGLTRLEAIAEVARTAVAALLAGGAEPGPGTPGRAGPACVAVINEETGRSFSTSCAMR